MRKDEEGKKRERRQLRDEVQRLQLCNTSASLRNWQPGKPTALRHSIVDNRRVNCDRAYLLGRTNQRSLQAHPTLLTSGSLDLAMMIE